MLVSHGGKEHRLNAETKKQHVCHLIFTKTEKESMNPEPAEKRKKPSPLIKQTLPHFFSLIRQPLPHVFFTLSSAHISHLFLCHITFAKRCSKRRKAGMMKTLLTYGLAQQ
jgi:hypothetical protein